MTLKIVSSFYEINNSYSRHLTDLRPSDYLKIKSFAQDLQQHDLIVLPTNANWYLSIYAKDEQLQAFYSHGEWTVISSNLLLQMILPTINMENMSDA